MHHYQKSDQDNQGHQGNQDQGDCITSQLILTMATQNGYHHYHVSKHCKYANF